MRHPGLLLTALAGCSFSAGGGATTSEDGAVPDHDATVAIPDAELPDAAPLARPLYAAADHMLYAIDVDAKSATPIGAISKASETFDVDGLAFDGTHLIGLSSGGAELITIDPATAQVTARKTIAPAGGFGGLTIAPAGELGAAPVVFAGNGTKLYRIDAATGAATMIGAWGNGREFYSDLAWVKGVGLYATLQGGECNSYCFARIDVSTGSAAVFRSNLTADIFGLSGYRDSLWALNGAGPLLVVDQATGSVSVAFDPAIHWTEAAQ